MKNSEVCREFAAGRAAHTENVSTDGNKLFSYATCIAQRKDGKIYVNRTKYSPTTSKHQSYLLAALRKAKEELVEVNDLPRGTYSLVG